MTDGVAGPAGVRIEAVSPAPADDGFLAELAALDEAATAADGHRAIGEHVFAELRAASGAEGMPHAGFTARGEGDAPPLLGYAHLSERGAALGWRLDVVVAPSHRRKGIGAALIAAVLDRARTDGGEQVHVHAWAWNAGPGHDRHEHLAARFGMRPVRTIERMSATLPLPGTEPPEPPPGVTFRPFRPGEDDEAWLAAHNEAFADHADAAGWTAADLAWQLAEPWFDPGGFILAEDDEGIAGYCWMKVEHQDAWVYFLGVRERARGTGLGRALAAAGIAWASDEKKARRCLLYVDPESAPAVRTYRSLGFTPDHRDVAYAVDL